jgi:hypothetical protein
MHTRSSSEPLSVLERARRYAQKCAPAVSGQGGHKVTFRLACALLHGFALSEQDALNVLREWNLGCQPRWSEAELVHKAKSAAAASPQKERGYLLGSHSGRQSRVRVSQGTVHGTGPAPMRPRKVVFDAAVAKRIASLLPGTNEDFVKARSPICPETQTPASFLGRLYRPGENILVFNVFESQGLHVCECVEPPYDAGCLDHLINGCKDGVWFLCNPVDGEYHANPRLDGKMSRRSEESVTAWRYLVIESDQVCAKDWLAVIVQMPLRIAAIYTSGGRSVHALVRVDAESKADWDAKARELKPLLTVLGADPGAITAVRLTRLPGCYRGQDGPPAPAQPFARKRWVDEPLKFDEYGDPIWTPNGLGRAAGESWTGGRLQELLYLNPTPDLEPIFKKATRSEIYARWLAGSKK